jgi:hypothetical protein
MVSLAQVIVWVPEQVLMFTKTNTRIHTGLFPRVTWTHEFVYLWVFPRINSHLPVSYLQSCWALLLGCLLGACSPWSYKCTLVSVGSLMCTVVPSVSLPALVLRLPHLWGCWGTCCTTMCWELSSMLYYMPRTLPCLSMHGSQLLNYSKWVSINM